MKKIVFLILSLFLGIVFDSYASLQLWQVLKPSLKISLNVRAVRGQTKASFLTAENIITDHFTKTSMSQVSYPFSSGKVIRLSQRTPAITSTNTKPKLFCDKSNYKEYIFSERKTINLILQNNTKVIDGDNKKIACDLEGLDLSRMNLAKTHFLYAYLASAKFIKSNLVGAFFNHAYLMETLFMGANLTGAIMLNSELAFVDLTGAILIKANLSSASFVESDLPRANLTGAILFEVSFSGTKMPRAILVDSDCRRIYARNVDFTGVNMLRANCRGARILDSSFQGGDLTSADLSNTILSNVDFTQTILHKTIFTGAEYNKATKFPKNFDPKKHGMIYKENLFIMPEDKPL